MSMYGNDSVDAEPTYQRFGRCHRILSVRKYNLYLKEERSLEPNFSTKAIDSLFNERPPLAFPSTIYGCLSFLVTTPAALYFPCYILMTALLFLSA